MKKLVVLGSVFVFIWSLFTYSIPINGVYADDEIYYGYFEKAATGEESTDNQNFFMSRDGIEKIRVYCINHNTMAPWRDNYEDAVSSNLAFEKILANQANLEDAVQENIHGADLEENVRKILYYIDYIDQNTLTTLLSNKLVWRATGSGVALSQEEIGLYDDILENTVVPSQFVVELFKPNPEDDNGARRQTLARGYLVYQDGVVGTMVSVDGESASASAALTLTSEDNLTIDVVDTIAFEGLFADETYNVTTTLYQVSGGVLGAEVKKVETTFTPPTADGTTNVKFADVTLEVGKTYVVFEEMVSVNSFEFADGNKPHRAEHKDVTDNAQTIIVKQSYPEYQDGKIGTTVSVDGESASASAVLTLTSEENLTIDVVDTIAFEGLFADETYNVTATLYQVSGGVLGAEVKKVATTFTPTTANGTTDVTFSNVTLEVGKTYVVFEEMVSANSFEFADGNKPHRAEHKDVTDSAQTIIVVKEDEPALEDGKIGTTVSVGGESASATAALMLTSEDNLTIDVVDTIAFEGLFAGETYNVTATLYQVSSGAVGAKVHEISTTFTPTTANGTTDVTFSNVTLEVGKTYVVFEEMVSANSFEFADGNRQQYLEHKDVNDKAQTIIVVKEDEPVLEDGKIGTAVSVDGVRATTNAALTLTSKNNLTKDVVDTIAFKGLFAGETYNVTATLYQVSGGVLGAEVKKVETTFTPTMANGTTNVTFAAVTLEVGKRYVVFEEMESVNSFDFADGNRQQYLEHKDVNDKAQTIIVVEKNDSKDEEEVTKTTTNDDDKPKYKDGKIGTTVSIDGESASATVALTLTSENNLTKDVVDTIAFEDLIKGETYNVIATLYEVSGGVLGAEVKKVETTFTPTTANGTTNVTFADVTLEVGKTYVVFEEMVSANSFEFADGNRQQRLEHKDVNDNAQTIVVVSSKVMADLDETISVKVTKKWVGLKNDLIQPPADSIVVELYKNGSATGMQLELGKSNNWTAEFNNLKVYDGTEEAVNRYVVKEVTETNNLVKFGQKHFNVTYTGDMKNGFVITNQETKVLPDAGEQDNSMIYAILLLLSGLGLILKDLFEKKTKKTTI